MNKAGLIGAGMLALAALSGCDKSKDQGGEASANMSAAQVAGEMKKISLQPGEWEMVQEITDVTIEGAPKEMPADMMRSMIGRKTTIKDCVTPEEAANPSADFLAAQKDSKCTYSGFEMAGGVIKGSVSCPAGEGGAMTASMQGIYQPTSYAMTMESKMAGMAGPQGPMSMHMKMKTTGKRIGECKPGAAG